MKYYINRPEHVCLMLNFQKVLMNISESFCNWNETTMAALFLNVCWVGQVRSVSGDWSPPRAQYRSFLIKYMYFTLTNGLWLFLFWCTANTAESISKYGSKYDLRHFSVKMLKKHANIVKILHMYINVIKHLFDSLYINK